MQNSDRGSFDALVQKLAQGFGHAPGKERLDAYWSAFQALSLTQFARIVEHALSPEYAAKLDTARPQMPSVPQLWMVNGLLKARAQSAPQATGANAGPRDSLQLWANRQLLIHIFARGGLGSTGHAPSAELSACLKLRDALVDEFDGYVAEGDDLATPREYLRRWVAGLRAIGAIAEDALARYREAAQSAEGRAPFPRWMASAPRTAEARADG